MMNRLQQAWVWLSRIGHSRGFGIQSPSDYRFVRYVVSEHWPYYAYARLGQHDGWLRRKLGCFYFRLANHLQPRRVADLVGVGEYLQAGCRGARVERTPSAAADLVIAPPTESASRLLSLCHDGTVLVVEDIAHHDALWQTVVADPRVTVTFDLYYCGVACFDPQRVRQNYIVNF